MNTIVESGDGRNPHNFRDFCAEGLHLDSISDMKVRDLP